MELKPTSMSLPAFVICRGPRRRILRFREQEVEQWLAGRRERQVARDGVSDDVDGCWDREPIDLEIRVTARRACLMKNGPRQK